MSIENARQLENTKAKLGLLEASMARLKQEPGPNAYVDSLTLESLHSQIKQLKEEIARYETRSASRVPAL